MTCCCLRCFSSTKSDTMMPSAMHLSWILFCFQIILFNTLQNDCINGITFFFPKSTPVMPVTPFHMRPDKDFGHTLSLLLAQLISLRCWGVNNNCCCVWWYLLCSGWRILCSKKVMPCRCCSLSMPKYASRSKVAATMLISNVSQRSYWRRPVLSAPWW